jgi:uncharacterized membrane protein YhaH (DUF805 family)
MASQDWPLFRWLFFRFDGRISRVPFLLGLLLLGVLQVFPFYRFMLVPPESVEAGVWSIIFLFIAVTSVMGMFAITAKRLHDLGRNGVEALVLMIPIASTIAIVYLCLAPGNDGPNRFGRETNAPASTG